MFNYPKNEPIAQFCFDLLVLDFEYDNFVSGRVLRDGYYLCHISADNKDNFIEKFMSGNYSGSRRF